MLELDLFSTQNEEKETHRETKEELDISNPLFSNKAVKIDMSDNDYARLGNPHEAFSNRELESAIWRASDLKSIYKRNLYDLLISGYEFQESDALTYGSALHTYILEPHKFYDLFAVGDVQDDDDREYLTRTQFEDIEKMRDNIMKKYDVVLEGAELKEIVVESDIDGIKCKVKIDIPFIEEDGSLFLVDLKTTGEEMYSRRTLYAVHDYLYCLQMAFYEDVCKNAGLKVSGSGLLFTSKEDFKCQLYKMPRMLIEHGREQYQKSLGEIRSALTNGDFSESGFIETLHIPEWIAKKY